MRLGGEERDALIGLENVVEFSVKRFARHIVIVEVSKCSEYLHNSSSDTHIFRILEVLLPSPLLRHSLDGQLRHHGTIGQLDDLIYHSSGSSSSSTIHRLSVIFLDTPPCDINSFKLSKQNFV